MDMENETSISQNDGRCPEEQLRFCVKEMFTQPTNNINKAFDIIVQMIKKQDDENKKIKLEHEEFRKDSLATQEKMHSEYTSINKSLRVEFEKEQSRLSKELISVHDQFRENYEGLNISNNMFNESMKNVQKNIIELREEIKVCYSYYYL